MACDTHVQVTHSVRSGATCKQVCSYGIKIGPKSYAIHLCYSTEECDIRYRQKKINC